MMNFAVLYLGQLGLGAYGPSLLVGSGLGTAVYVLPLFCGALADRMGFRKVLMGGAALLALGYGALAWPLGPGRADPPQSPFHPSVLLPVGLGLGCVALGRSLLNPACAATIQKTAGPRTGMAFGLYVMMTNAGTLAGLSLCRCLRKGIALDAVFTVALGAAATAFLLGAGWGKEPPGPPAARRLGEDLLSVLRDRRFQRFLLSATGFFVLFAQTFILVPLYLQRAVDPHPPLELYGMIHPLLAVVFQVPVSRALKGVAPAKGIALGTLLLGGAMLCNVPALFLAGGLQTRWGPLPAGALGILGTLALSSLALMAALPKMYEYMGSLAPPGKEGLLLGYSTLPMALGNLLGGFLGPLLLDKVMGRNATGMLLDPWAASTGWALLSLFALASAAAIWAARRLT